MQIMEDNIELDVNFINIAEQVDSYNMINQISLRNFKSYESADIPLGPLTFLIGANASGKSNLLEAIRLLPWLANGGRLDDIARNIQRTEHWVRGQLSDWFRAPTDTISLGCQFSSMLDDWSVLKLSVSTIAHQLVVSAESVEKPTPKTIPLYKIVSDPNLHSDEIQVAYNNFKQGKNKPQIPCSNRQAIFYQLLSPARFESQNRESQKKIPYIATKIREQLRKIVFLDPKPARMRSYSYINDDILMEDGANISSILFNICQHRESKGLLLNFIRSLPEQNISDIQFIRTDRKDVMVRLVETFGGENRVMDAPVLSDGTLRVLAVAGVLLSTPSYSLVIIEEIDNGIHPSRAENLVKQIKHIAKLNKLQVLVTTHNPALLDALPNDTLADVLCCYRDLQQGDSRIVRLSDLEQFPELMAQGTLGELVTQQVLDRYLKDDTTEEERKQKALAWLEELKHEVGE